MASKAAADTLQQEKITQFVALTGVDTDRALFFLQAAAWNLDSALSSFFDNTEPSHSGFTDPLVPVQETQLPDPAAVPVPPEVSDDHPSGSGHSSHQTSKGGRGGVATLSDYKEKPRTTPSEGKGQEFFAGGSEHSGQMIEGPPRKKATPESMAKDVFESAKQHGAISVEDEQREQEKQKSAAFLGSGFKLGDSEGPSVQIPGRQSQQPEEKVRRTLTFWKDGFSVDDGELRTGETEEDRAFIQSVSKGEIPQELVHAAKGGEIDIDIQDRRTEAYAKPKPKLVAFSGEGHKLGGLAPEVVGPKTTPSDATPPPSVPLDPSQPTTSVQIRLADGSRLVAKFNHNHTVNDIRQFINLSRPSSSSLVYALMTTFPNRELTDPTQTLIEAKLLNAVVVQRMK